jgi:type III secretion protein T
MNGVLMPEDIRWLPELLFETLQALDLSTGAVALYMIRFTTVMAVMPIFSDQIINTMSRMGMAMLLACYVALGRPANELDGFTGGEIGLIAVKEVMLGLAMGFAMSTVFWVVEFAAALIDTAAGFNSVQMQNPMSNEQSTPVANMFSKLAGAVFFAIGGGVFLAQAMFDSFQAWPLADLHPSAQGAYAVFIERQVGTMFSSVLKLAAPVLIVIMLIDVGIGLLARSAEKLEPSSLGQPIKGVVSVLLVVLMTGAVFDQLRQYLVPRAIVRQLTPEQPDSKPPR